MKICFWGNISKALTGSTTGGGELQNALLAKALARAGHEVVVLDYEILEDFQTAEGIKVYHIEGYNNGIRIIRTLTHRLPKIYQSLRDQKADVYYCRIRDFRHILAFWAARKVKAKFVLGLASDLDAMNFIMRLKYHHLVFFGGLWGIFSDFLIEIVYPWLLRRSDLVLVQHGGQKRILEKKGINSLVFPNLFEMSVPPVINPDLKKDFIYVGLLDKRKGFIEFFEVVNKAPSCTFKVIGQPRDKAGHLYYEKLKFFKNVQLLGQMVHSETIHHIANSKALISTSPMEGFPNIFIEAWANGIPVLSLYVDPGDIIKNERLGEVSDGDMGRLLDSMTHTMNSEEFVRRAKAYVEHNHVLNADKIKEIDSLFLDLVRNGKPKN